MKLRPRVYNWQREPVDERDFKSIAFKRFVGAPPPYYKVTNQAPVTDQGSIGSCTAQTGALVFNYEIYDKIKQFVDLSEMFLYYKVRELIGTISWDSGGYVRDAFKALNKWGIPKEEFWPYYHAITSTPDDKAIDNARKHMALVYAKVDQNESVIKQTLLSGHTISFGFDVYDSFETGNWWYTSGVMPIPKSGERFLGGHAVTIIGYDDNNRCFLIQNSWGTDWGLKGLFWMPYSYLLSNHCSDFWTIEEIKIEGSPEPEPKPEDNSGCLLLGLKKIFTNYSDLTRLREHCLVQMGKELGLETDIKLLKRENLGLIKDKLEL